MDKLLLAATYISSQGQITIQNLKNVYCQLGVSYFEDVYTISMNTISWQKTSSYNSQINVPLEMLCTAARQHMKVGRVWSCNSWGTRKTSAKLLGKCVYISTKENI
jgi:hypothetical protein